MNKKKLFDFLEVKRKCFIRICFKKLIFFFLQVYPMIEDSDTKSVLVSHQAGKDANPVDPVPSIAAEYIFFPIYDFLVLFIPRWVTPNMLTIFGITCTLTSSLLMLSSMNIQSSFEPPRASAFPIFTSNPKENVLGPLHPLVVEPVFSFFSPASLMILCGMLNLLYCIADNTDGRLARRDHRSSVIGEYLDHSLDCVTSLLSIAVLFAGCGTSSANMSVTMFSVSLATVLCHTLTYETKRFVFGNRLLSVDEAMVFFGVGLWIPLVFPHLPFTALPLPQVVIDVLPPLAGFRFMDVVYCCMFLGQGLTALGICRSLPRLVLRFQVLTVLVAGAVFLLLIPSHCAAAEAVDAAQAGWWIGYQWGPFSYFALWTLTAASTFSTIIHIPIVGHCLKQPSLDYHPIGGVLMTLLLFVGFPVCAMLWSVTFHVVQIAFNIYRLLSSKEPQKRH